MLGLVTGKITVEEGARLLLRGRASGDMEVFGTAEVVGIVMGTVFNHGELIVSGTVGAIVEEYSGVTKILESGTVRDR